MESIRYLLDTHTFLWAVSESHKLSTKVKDILSFKSNKCYISAVSAYEIMNKHRLGKLQNYNYIVENYIKIIHEFDVDELSINSTHSHFAGKFDWKNRDPFDRILAAQAFKENLILLTNDTSFQSLPWLKTLW